MSESGESMDDGIDPPGLTARQAMFCREYLVDLNATQAAIRAGYSEDTARVIGSENLSKPAVAADIARRKRDRSARVGIDADRVLVQLSRLAFSDIRCIARGHGELNRLEEIDDDTAAAIQSVKLSTRPSGELDGDGRQAYEDVIEYKLAEKRGPLSDLAKHLGELTERHEHTIDEESRELLGWLHDKYGPSDQ